MRKGFTLIELLIVVAILGVLAGLVEGFSLTIERDQAQSAWMMVTQQAIDHLERETRDAAANLVRVQPASSPAELLLTLRGAEGELRQRRLAIVEDELILLADASGEVVGRRLGSAPEIALVPYRVQGREGFFVRTHFQRPTRLLPLEIQHEFFVGAMQP